LFGNAALRFLGGGLSNYCKAIEKRVVDSSGNTFDGQFTRHHWK
jgi:hypothetical protein